MENKYETDKIQSTAVKIRTKKQNITIAAANCPPGKNLKQEDYQEFFATLGEIFILGGNYNAKNTQWGSRLITTKGRELMKAINSVNCNIHTIGRPTYWPTGRNKIPDVIDFYISKKVPMHYMKIEDSYDLGSDHSMIIMTLSDKIIKKEANPTLTNKFTDWESFQSELNKDTT
jgi:hypothetical protein